MMERELKVKTEYLKLIVDLGYDYDGMATRDGLQGVIDDIVDLARKAIAVDDKSVIYENFSKGNDKKYFNILMEEINNASTGGSK